MGMDRLDEKVRLELAAQAMSATIRLAPGLTPAELDENALRAIVAGRNILMNSEAAEAIKKVVADYFQGGAAELERVLISGEPPVHGVDGRFEPAPAAQPPVAEGGPAEPNQPQASPEPDLAGRVDHHERSAFTIIPRGTLLGRLIPATPGRDGRDLLGKTLVAREGRPYPLAADESITIADDGQVTAACDGVLEMNLPRLKVRSRLRVEGFVDFSTGNIDVPGDVAIDRGVRDGFVVKAAGEVRIGALVEAATVECGRDAALDGGMAARGKGRLKIARDCRAKYLDSVTGAVGRDLLVSKEIVNCTLAVGRSLVGITCGVTGGELVVAGPVEIDTIGSESGVDTVVRLGVSPELESAAIGLSELIPQLETRCARGVARLEQLKAATNKLTARQAEEMTELEFESATGATQLAKVRATLDKLRSFAAARTSVQLVVHGRLHPGVKLFAGRWTIEISAEKKGPLKLTLGPKGEPQVTCPKSGHVLPTSGWARLTKGEPSVLQAEPAGPAGLISDSGARITSVKAA